MPKNTAPEPTNEVTHAVVDALPESAVKRNRSYDEAVKAAISDRKYRLTALTDDAAITKFKRAVIGAVKAIGGDRDRPKFYAHTDGLYWHVVETAVRKPKGEAVDA